LSTEKSSWVAEPSVFAKKQGGAQDKIAGKQASERSRQEQAIKILFGRDLGASSLL
jgi:hypothetical protein